MSSQDCAFSSCHGSTAEKLRGTPEVVRCKLGPTTAKSTPMLPTRASNGAAGYDLYTSEDVVVHPMKFTKIPTGVSLEIPTGVYGKVDARSGLALRHDIIVGAGVIDSDYRGEISVLLTTLSESKIIMKKGERIAQIIFHPCWLPGVELCSELSETARGSGGFGSTGEV